MPEIWIKICGLRTAADVEAAAAAGADAVGFVFHELSARYLAPADARRLQAAVPDDVERVAVFLHPSQGALDAVIDAVRPDWIQTDLEDLEHLVVPPGQRVLPVLRKSGSEQNFARVMLEGGTSGAGARADWRLARELAARFEVVLAGGLDAGNVAEAIRSVRPFGVDVSSGVETAPGVKDPARIQEFIRAAREAGHAGPRRQGE